jgi:hypothetical protein
LIQAEVEVSCACAVSDAETRNALLRIIEKQKRAEWKLRKQRRNARGEGMSVLIMDVYKAIGRPQKWPVGSMDLNALQ